MSGVKVELRVWIYAQDDAAADETIRAIQTVNLGNPSLPTIAAAETSREVDRWDR